MAYMILQMYLTQVYLILEYFPELVNYRRTEATLSSAKLKDLIHDYEEYHKNNFIPDERKVHMTKEEILELNKYN